jgi:SAM-dependent methyltransferase
MELDPLAHNRRAWDLNVEKHNPWTVPVGPEVIAAARHGRWEIVLTPRRSVPRAWFPALEGLRTLCLASGGGQQGPVLAAAGADVVVFDLSPAQLAQDRSVAEREGLAIETVEGDMRDLSAFADASFGLVVHPVSNCFVPEVRPVWEEVARVLVPGGTLLAGSFNPAVYVFDEDLAGQGRLEVRHALPYSDTGSLDPGERERLFGADEAVVFSHTLEDLLGGQADAGLAITGLFEDEWPGKAVSRYMPAFLVTRAVKLTR